jgi:hypothetical protein
MIKSDRTIRLDATQWLLVRRIGLKRKNTDARTVVSQRFRQRFSESDIPSPAKAVVITTDHWLIAVGVAAAIGSAGFATITINQNTRPNVLKSAEYPKALAQALLFRSLHLQNNTNKPKGRLVDYNATGSISEHSTENLLPMPNFSGNSASGDATKTYVLRFVHKNAALLQNEYGFYVARRGTVLPDAGKVLSIKKLGDTWILTTTTRIFYENHE